MSNIPEPTMQAIHQQAQSILNKYGEGSLYRKPGKKPQYTFFYDNELGEKKRKTLSIPEGADPQQIKLEFITQTLIKRYQLQQEQKKRQLLQETISKDFLEKVDKLVESLPETQKALKPCTKTVSQVIDEYLAHYKATNVGYVTYHAAEIHTNRIRYALGTKKISDITSSDFQYLLNNLFKLDNSDERLSKQYTSLIRNDFISILKYAKKHKYIASYSEIIEDVKIPQNLKKNNSDDKFLTYDELARVLYAVHENTRYYSLLTIMVLTGLRIQEILALRIQDIEHEKNRLHIVQATKLNEKKSNTDRNITLGDPKTDNSSRYVPAINSVLCLLDRWIAYTEKEGMRDFARAKGYEDLVFINKNGEVSDRDPLLCSLTGYINRLKDDSIPHITFHMCRHCFATYLYREHCDLQIIQQCMGHTTKRGSVTEIHYITPDPDYVNKALPYVEAVEKKLIQACKKVENEYLNKDSPKT